MVVTKGITNREVFERMLRGYHEGIVSERNAANPPAPVEENQVVQEVEESAATENRRMVKCCLKDCRRRSPTDCIHKMCFLCCYEVRRAAPVLCQCPPHHKESLRREEEDRYIESLLLEKSKPRSLPRFFEEKFTAAGQTVTIWCLRDFLRNKSFSEETLQQEQRQFRQQALVRRREEFRSGLVGNTHSIPKKRGTKRSRESLETTESNLESQDESAKETLEE